MNKAQEIARLCDLYDPDLVTFDDDGTTVLEWWSEHRKITIYIEASGSIHYIKSWGLDPNDEMEDGCLDILDALGINELIRWLELETEQKENK